MNLKTTNTNTRNFFQKTFILLAILTFTSFGFKAKAQQFHTDVQFFNNTSSGCDWVVEGFSLLTSKFSQNVFSPSTSQVYQTWSTGLLDRITITDGTCVLTFTASAGVFPVTTYTSPCSGTTCAISISGSGSQSGSGCAVDGYIIIQIYY